jgi:hypothetical protein
MPDIVKSRRIASYISNGNSPARAPAAKARRKTFSTPRVYPFQVSDARAPSTKSNHREVVVVLGVSGEDGVAPDKLPLQELNFSGE